MSRRDRAGRRTISANEFFVAELTTALEDDEMLREIHLPKAEDGSRAAFAEIGSHFGGLAIIGVAAQVTGGAGRACSRVSLAATGAGDRPMRLPSAEAILIDEVLSGPTIEAAAEAAITDVDPFGDLHATAHWRRRAVVAMVARALGEIASRDGTR